LDVHVGADLGVKQALSDLLTHNYDPHWLSLGLEIVLGKAMPAMDMAHLSAFINQVIVVLFYLY
jgi:hypothetical protein